MNDLIAATLAGSCTPAQDLMALAADGKVDLREARNAYRNSRANKDITLEEGAQYESDYCRINDI